MKLVEDLGEETFPEPKDASSAAAGTGTTSDSASVTSETSTLVDDDSMPSSPTPTTSTTSETTKTVESQEPLPNEPTREQIAEQLLHEHHDRKVVTTDERKPMTIPESVHVKITPENLKDYVGPPVYQKDRMYVIPPPPGVSTGLGYLGNGSGAVMPVEAMVRIFLYYIFHLGIRMIDVTCIEYAR